MAFKMKGSTLYGKLSVNRSGYSNLEDGRSKSSAFQKAGCMEAGDPGCGGNFKVKKKGTVVSRALKKAGRFISSEVKDLKSDIRRRKVKRKRTKIQKSAKTGSYGNPRYLTKGHPNPKGL